MPYKIYKANRATVIQRKNPNPFSLTNPRYCPQDITGWYDLPPATPDEDTSNYCPQDNTGFYDFDQAP